MRYDLAVIGSGGAAFAAAIAARRKDGCHRTRCTCSAGRGAEGRAGPTIGAMQGGTLVQGDLIVGGWTVPAMESVPAAPELSRLPAGSELFVGRTGELERLDRVAASSGRAVVVAVHGLGGVGKSTLAARFAHLHAERFTLVW